MIGIGLVHVSGGWLGVADMSGLGFGWQGNWSVALNHRGGVLLHPRVFFGGVDDGGLFDFHWLRFNRDGLYYMLSDWLSEGLNWSWHLSTYESGSKVFVSVEKSSNGLAEMRVVSVSSIEISEMLVESVPVEFSVLLVTVLHGVLGSQL